MFVVFIDRQAALFLVAAFSLFFVGLLLLGVMLYQAVKHRFEKVCELIEAEETALEERQGEPSKGRLFLVDGDEVY